MAWVRSACFVASSWKVADEDARLLMEAFYRRLGSGAAPAAALRAARLDRRTAAPHPCHWAAFTLWGLPE